MDARESELTLLKMRNLELMLGRRPSESVVELLCETIWGTPGGIRYQHFNTSQKIQDLHDPWFLYLQKDDEAIGVLCLDHRFSAGAHAYYIRYFSFSEGMRRKQVVAKAKLETETAGQAARGQGVFKRFISRFFEEPKELLEHVNTPQALFYAFVELENVRSREMVAQMGLSPCGRFQTHIFSRIFTRPQPQVRRARQDEHPHLRATVREAYADHAFFHDHGLFYQDNFFVLEIEGKVVAGCQAHHVHWRVVELPGRSGKMMMRVLPILPLISRLFNPQKFEFAAIEGLFCLQGYETHIQTLLLGVLHLQGVHAALWWADKSANLYQRLAPFVRWGILQSLQKDAEGTVVFRNYGLSHQEVADLQAKPVYVSAFDAT